MPLVGMEPIANVLPGPLSDPLALHIFVAVGSSLHPDQCLVLDFLPERPTHPATALALGSGGSTRGVMRVRRTTRWVSGRAVLTREVGRLQPSLEDGQLMARVQQHNSTWSPDLRIGSNDCRHYAAALLGALTGRHYGLADL